jgi:predicted ATPase
MISKIEALNYRALRYIQQPLSPFQVLIGPNASGKTTFLDVIAFVGETVQQSTITEVVRERVSDFRDLTWMRGGEVFELALEVILPDHIAKSYPYLRYEMRVGIEAGSGEIALLTENLWLLNESRPKTPSKSSFPDVPTLPDHITRDSGKHTPSGWRKIISKTANSDYFRSETTDWNSNFGFGRQRSALGNLPIDERRFPAASWFKTYLAQGVQKLVLNSEALRRPSPPQSPKTFLPDGSNLPWVIRSLEENAPDQLHDWINHVRTALPDIEGISTVERPEDRHLYLVVKYANGLQVPAWLVSDGTLRMLALTILAYLPPAPVDSIYLIEEPENGIHPNAVETVFQSLSSVYSAQVFLATHSPAVLGLAEPQQLLCFAKNAAGMTDIVRGDQHPKLGKWQNQVDLATLFAAGF